MDRFVRRVAPKLAADSAPQPVEVPAAAAAADVRRVAPKLAADSAPQPVEVPAAAAAADETESHGEASSVDGEYSHITRLLDELAEEQPAAAQWAAQLPSDAEVTSSFDAYLRHRARQLLGYIATLTTVKIQRKDKVVKLNRYLLDHTVAENQARLRQKAAKQLRELHGAAQAHRPDADAYLQALNAAKDGSPHAAQLLLWGFNLLDPTRNQTAMWRVKQGLLSGKPVPKKGVAQRNRAKAIRDDVWQLWQRKAAQFLPEGSGISGGSSSSTTIRSMFSSKASAASHTLAAPQREASLLQDAEGNDHTSQAAASSAAPPAAALETLSRVPFGDIAYGTSEWFWMPGISSAPGRLEDDFRERLRMWEGCNCPAHISASQWRERVLRKRQQGSLPEALAGEPLTLDQHIAAAAESLRNEIATMKRKTAREFAHALCVPRGHKTTTEDELRKLQETTAELEDEAKKAALNLAGYRFQSRLTVFAYWCCDRRQRERKAVLMSRLVEPIEEENGRCRTQVILDEADGQPHRTRRMRQQLRRLHKYIDEDFMSPYRERILKALANDKVRYVAGAEIDGTDLYDFPLEPRLTAPLHCMLCGDGFASDAALEKHVVTSHVSMAEYRKRVLFKYEERGPQAVTPSEKRNMVQNFAHFQQYSHPGAGSCVFSGETPVPRSEAACAICARLDWKEHRVKLNLFAAPPAVSDAKEEDLSEQSSDDDWKTTAASKKAPVVWFDGVAYLQNPKRVQELLSVERYQERWPLIPQEELHASSIQHPDNPSWRWLLHSRRVPVLPNSGALQPAPEDPDRPPCAGIGDASMPVWSCRACQQDLCGPHPKLPLNAVANDNWIGREKLLVRNSTRATHWLSSLGRFCWKQVRLGRGPASSGAAQPADDVRQTGVSGNTIFFAQPTAEVPRMTMPPDEGDFLNSLNVLFTKNTQRLDDAEWAQVNRAEYLQIVKLRQQECASFKHVVVDDAKAERDLPEFGVPPCLLATCQEVEGMDNAPVQLDGPASRAPEHSFNDDAGEASEDDTSDCSISDSSSVAPGEHPASESTAATRPHKEQRCSSRKAADTPAASLPTTCAASLADLEDGVAISSIAVDPVHHLQPVQMMQALQGKIELMHEQAATIAKNELKGKVADADGVLQPVADEGGRYQMRNIVLDMQQIANDLGREGATRVEKAAIGAETCRLVSPTALAVPINEPLSAYDPRTYPISSVHWWFGDGAPNLQRQRPMLYEEVARRLMDVEEMEYKLPGDETPYEARSPSRFTDPEVLAMLGDAVRRLKMLQGVRATIQRRGFWQDLKSIAEATVEEFMAANKLAKRNESMGSAAARADMPAKVRAALRTLLLSTADVPGTEGRKQTLRHQMHAANLMFGSATFFVTPNHADTYSPLMLLLHNGPPRDDHLNIDAPQLDAGLPNEKFAFDIRSEAPSMPSLHRMHQIAAGNPRAQARFYLLMQTLHFGCLHGFDMLHIGRVDLVSPSKKHPRHDTFASKLQPAITPAAADVELPGEAQGRGFTHGHGKGHSRIGVTVAWIRDLLKENGTDASQRIKEMRKALLRAAASVQYESANEPAIQMGVLDLPPEPFTEKQQRQSKMDGALEDDGITKRDLVKLQPPLEQEHVGRERRAAAAANRPPLKGTAAFRQMPLTCAHQSSFPAYRLRGSFGQLQEAAAGAPQPGPQQTYATEAELCQTDPTGKVIAFLKADGQEASEEDFQDDAQQWARHFGTHVRNGMCFNHDHQCQETCVKNTKNKLEALRDLKKRNSVPTCRFWFFRIMSLKKLVDGVLKLRRVRRRGKPLVEEPYIETSAERNEQYRCKVKRAHPFRSASSDVAQAECCP
jgi:hypothetical protein